MASVLAPRPPPPKSRQQQENLQQLNKDYGTPNPTLYVRNLNERINTNGDSVVIKNALKGIFENYGTVVDVQIKSNIRMRGQAFILFKSQEEAKEAIKADKFPLFGKPLDVQFAKNNSFYHVQKDKGDDALSKLKKERQKTAADRETKYQQMVDKATENGKIGAKRKLSVPSFPMGLPPFMRPPMPGAPIPMGSNGRPMMPPLARPGMMPGQIQFDEMLPPNKILFLQNLNQGIGQSILTDYFSNFTGFQEIRLVPGRPDIAFVEFESEESAIIARNGAPNGLHKINEQIIKVTFARK